jgi:hypothetical protein
MMPQRPKSIVQFELIYWAVILLGLINTALGWSDMIASVQVQRMIAQVGSASVYATVLFGVVLQLLLWYFVARRGSVIAKWIFVLLTAATILFSVPTLLGGTSGSVAMTVINIALVVLQLVAVVLLFRADARDWFGEGVGEDEADPAA